ncbi:MAG: hypothetical protein EU539_12070 [Promethearchaeota archaeon]|nr:MAG: hypothetical protein EU539_12070 [Candidatus Lokiarchaeota archaeon]
MVFKRSNYTNEPSIGQFFTPKFIAKFMVKNSLNFVKNAKSNGEPEDFLKRIKVLEPSVGKGVFLKYLSQSQVKNIVAYEIDLNLKEFLLKSYPTVEFRFENVLGSDLDEKFDLIIGNPPYLGQNYNAELFQEYIKKYPLCEKYFVGNMDLFYFFIHLGILKLKPGGILCFITTNYWITKSKKTGIKFLKPHILNECYLLQYINLAKLKLFNDATGQHNCIFILQKKNESEKTHKINKKIEIIQIRRNPHLNLDSGSYNNKVFNNLIQNQLDTNIINYFSAISNNELSREGNWNLLYPEEVKEVINEIEKFCIKHGNTSYLKDLFIIRNGLILIKDEIFILNERDSLKVEGDDYFIKIKNEFHKLNETEKRRLKKLYKSKSITPYTYKKDHFIGYLIYFNKTEFDVEKAEKRDEFYEKKYPNLILYLKQFETDLREILVNAKENPDDLYFPRRGSIIRKLKKDQGEELIDLEPLYDKGKKIFFKFISKNNNFGYTEDSYYATSDTYFLWPKESEGDIDYEFLIAYLNSKLVSFIFTAKNIYIKRSKTKLENGIPVPNLKTLNSGYRKSIFSLIKDLSSYLISSGISSKVEELKYLKNKLIPHLNSMDDYKKSKELINALKKHDINHVQKILDKLFFDLFNLEEERIGHLIGKYY